MNMDDPRSFVGHLSDPAAELRAAFFAAKAHGSQRYGNGSYTDHLFDVRQVMWDHRIGGAPAVAALLHDTIEDTDTTREDIAKLFGDYTAALVWAVSGMPKGAPRRVRKADAYAKIRAMPAAIVVKLADRIANVQSCVLALPHEHEKKRGLFKMYASEQEEFEELLRVTKADVLYPEMVSHLRRLFVRGSDG